MGSSPSPSRSPSFFSGSVIEARGLGGGNSNCKIDEKKYRNRFADNGVCITKSNNDCNSNRALGGNESTDADGEVVRTVVARTNN